MIRVDSEHPFRTRKTAGPPGSLCCASDPDPGTYQRNPGGPITIGFASDARKRALTRSPPQKWLRKDAASRSSDPQDSPQKLSTTSLILFWVFGSYEDVVHRWTRPRRPLATALAADGQRIQADPTLQKMKHVITRS